MVASSLVQGVHYKRAAALAKFHTICVSLQFKDSANIKAIRIIHCVEPGLFPIEKRMKDIYGRVGMNIDDLLVLRTASYFGNPILAMTTT
jgi:hypothetical protein